jgi:dipeptidyl aminopeptidase/acylaminoacyl peptidase
MMMFWLITRLTTLLFLCLALLLVTSASAGQHLPPAPVAVSIQIERGEQGKMTVSARDLHLGGIYQRTMSGGRGMFWSEDACFVLVPQTESGGQESAMLDVIRGNVWHYPVVGYRLPSWSPDGSYMTLSYEADDGAAIAFLNATLGAYVPVVLPEGEFASQIDWSPDSRGAIITTGNTASGFKSYLVNPQTGALTTPGEGEQPFRIQTPEWHWSPDSRYIATIRRQPEPGILVIDITTNERFWLHELQPFRALIDFAWLPAPGQIALFGSVATGDETEANVPVISGSGSVDEGDAIRELDGFVWSIPGRMLQPTGLTTRESPPLHWSPDRTLLLEQTEAGTRVSRIETGEELLSIVPRRDIMSYRNLWSPDGRYMVLSSAHVDGKMRLVDLQTRHIVEQPSSDGAIEWSPDSRSFSLYNINSMQLELTYLDAGKVSTRYLPMTSFTRVCYPEAEP